MERPIKRKQKTKTKGKNKRPKQTGNNRQYKDQSNNNNNNNNNNDDDDDDKKKKKTRLIRTKATYGPSIDIHLPCLSSPSSPGATNRFLMMLTCKSADLADQVAEFQQQVYEVSHQHNILVTLRDQSKFFFDYTPANTYG